MNAVETKISRYPTSQGTLVNFEVKDGVMYNATRLCRDNGKVWTNFLRTKDMNRFMDEMSRLEGIEKDKLAKTTKLDGTWVHESILPALCWWISPDIGGAYDRLHKDQLAQVKQDLANANIQHDNFAKKSVALAEENSKLKNELTKVKNELHDVKTLWNKECQVKKKYNEWENDWRTVYEHVLKTYKIRLSEAKTKALDKVVSKNFKDDYGSTKMLWFQNDKYNDLIMDRPSLLEDTVKPERPDPPRNFSKLSPRNVHTFERRDWHLIDDQVDLFRDEFAQ